MPPRPPAEPRFAADAMLGRLARWLRVLGWDTFFDATVHDPELVRRADAEDRVLLTRDRHLLRALAPRRHIEIRHDAPLAQLVQVVRVLDPPPPAELFLRCTVCNGVLSAPVDLDQARPLLPLGLRHDPPTPVRACPDCGRLYWPGSHVRRMRDALVRSLPGWLDAAGREGSAGANR
ncbi:Mut7-C RNAse domain-containing protein [Ramlibacter rhizophilus]|uniref:Mut7-C RNAse domain-containing protein n=1 Tax=Ramlibacter rhizophilus TaxID=1781167 RepID=A0A4Z0BQF9_9BURK|nr:Mut7-C RNAse domain-containing protein [Ramlibacter rhizophilus]TFZ01081.1 hypothetical protein EZ242_06710 [Ramlibacter rhizophilus]